MSGLDFIVNQGTFCSNCSSKIKNISGVCWQLVFSLTKQAMNLKYIELKCEGHSAQTSRLI